jgi:hypothetical protein
VVSTSQVTAVSVYVQSSYCVGTIVGSPIPNVTRRPTAVRLPWLAISGAGTSSCWFGWTLPPFGNSAT